MKSTVPAATGRVALTIEVVVPMVGPLRSVRLVLSIPGREGASVRVWEVPEGVVDPPVYVDLCVAIEQAVLDAVTPLGGVQNVLPM